MIIDTHAHYDDKAFDEDRDTLLAGMAEAGISRIVNIGSSLDACRRTLELMDKYNFIYGAIGVHPCDSAELTEESLAWIREVSSHEKCVAIGEIGLDYYWDEPDRDIQKKWFVRQLDLARQVKLPPNFTCFDPERRKKLTGKEAIAWFRADNRRYLQDNWLDIAPDGEIVFKEEKDLGVKQNE